MTDRPARFAGPRRPCRAALAVLLTLASVLGLTAPASAQEGEPQTLASDVSWFELTPAGDRVVYWTSTPVGEGVGRRLRMQSVSVDGGSPTLIDTYRMRPHSDRTARPVFRTGWIDDPPSNHFSPDSERMAYLRQERRGGSRLLAVADISGGTVVELTDARVGSVLEFVMTPDWATAVFVARRTGETRRLYSVPVDGGPPVELAELSRHARAQLTPDGDRVVFVDRSGRRMRALRSVPVGGGDTIDLHEGGDVDSFTFGPDGRVVFVAAERPRTATSPYFLHASSPNHTRSRLLTPDPVARHQATLTPVVDATGTTVYYEDDTAPRRGLMQVGFDGRRARRVAQFDGYPGRLWASPDGRFVITSQPDYEIVEPDFAGIPPIDLRITDVERGTTKSFPGGIGITVTAVSPDSRHILVRDHALTGVSRLRVVTLGGATRIIGRTHGTGATFTSDSSRVVYWITRAGRSTIAVVGTDGRRSSTLVSSATTNPFFHFAVSDSMERVVYLDPGEGAASDRGELRIVDLPPAD